MKFSCRFCISPGSHVILLGVLLHQHSWLFCWASMSGSSVLAINSIGSKLQSHSVQISCIRTVLLLCNRGAATVHRAHNYDIENWRLKFNPRHHDSAKNTTCNPREWRWTIYDYINFRKPMQNSQTSWESRSILPIFLHSFAPKIVPNKTAQILMQTSSSDIRICHKALSRHQSITYEWVTQEPRSTWVQPREMFSCFWMMNSIHNDMGFSRLGCDWILFTNKTFLW